MSERFIRTEMVIGKENVNKLNGATVAIFGIGGVGGYVAEALARCGIGSFVLTDMDTISESNINRQIIALSSTVGQPKVEAMKARILDINPEAKVVANQCFYLPANANEFDFSSYSYVVDCVDTVTAKLELITRAQSAGVPIICAMGTGNKTDPSKFKIADIYDTDMDPLSRVMRKEAHKRGLPGFKVVYSTEKPVEPEGGFGEKELSEGRVRRSVPGSIAFVPSAAGLLIASEIVKDLCAR